MCILFLKFVFCLMAGGRGAGRRGRVRNRTLILGITVKIVEQMAGKLYLFIRAAYSIFSIERSKPNGAGEEIL